MNIFIYRRQNLSDKSTDKQRDKTNILHNLDLFRIRQDRTGQVRKRSHMKGQEKAGQDKSRQDKIGEDTKFEKNIENLWKGKYKNSKD